MQKTRARMSHRQYLVIITGPPATGKATLAPLVAPAERRKLPPCSRWPVMRLATSAACCSKEISRR
jgi:hypothetical protein